MSATATKPNKSALIRQLLTDHPDMPVPEIAKRAKATANLVYFQKAKLKGGNGGHAKRTSARTITGRLPAQITGDLPGLAGNAGLRPAASLDRQFTATYRPGTTSIQTYQFIPAICRASMPTNSGRKS